MKQLDLAAAPVNPAPALAPKLLLMTDAALGVEYTVAIGPDSPWFELLPKQQSVQVVRHAQDPASPAA